MTPTATPTPAHAPSAASGRVLGLLLGVSTLVSIVMLAHHPTAGGDAAVGLVERLQAVAAMAAAVHGVLIAVMLLQWLLLVELSARRGLGHWAQRSGLALWSLGIVTMLGAALVSGFLAPDIAALAMEANSVLSANEAADQIQLWHRVNQRLAETGSLAFAAGMAAWSLPMLRGAGLVRGIGAFGTLSAAGLALALGTGLLDLDVDGMLVVWLSFSAWLLAVSVALVRRVL